MLGLILAAAVNVPFTMYDNRIFVQTSLNGTRGFAMIVDSGSNGLLITPEAARRLHLSVRSGQALTGAGAGSLASGTATMRDARLNGYALAPHTTTVADLSAIRRAIGFPRLDGIIGFDALAARSIRIDMDRGIITLSADSLTPPQDAHRTPFALDGGFIHVDAAIDGIHGTAVIDTGDRSALTLFASFARRNGFYERTPLEHNVITGYGVGGPIRSDVFRTHLDAFGYGIADVRTRAPVGRAGVFSTAREAGSIGNATMKRFNTIYDYRANAIYTWPSKFFADAQLSSAVVTWLTHG